jgi:DNA polymerase-3 subunit alpha
MRFLVFDTETTGLPKSKYSDPKNIYDWPYIVQFSYIIYDLREHSIEKIVDRIIKIPSDVAISEESSRIHCITKNDTEERGLPIDEIIYEFINDFKTADVVVGHNLGFDINVLTAEMYRLSKSMEDDETKMLDLLRKIKIVNDKKKIYCTMKESGVICNIKAFTKTNKEYIKFPTLSELHSHLFGYVPRNLHNSLNDVMVTARCFAKLNFSVDIFEKNETMNEFYRTIL